MRGMSELSSRDAQKSYELFAEDDSEDLIRYLTDSDECQMLPGVVSMGNQQAGCCAAASSLVAAGAISQGSGNLLPETCFADDFDGCEAEGPFAKKLPTAQSLAAATHGFCADNFACATSIMAALITDTTGAFNDQILIVFDKDKDGEP